MNTMMYKNYLARIEYDSDVEIFHGEVINAHDVITFQGESVPELKQAMMDSVEFYLDHCHKIGKTPDRPLPGKFLLRFEDPQDHLKIYLAALREGKPITTWAREHLLKAANNVL